MSKNFTVTAGKPRWGRVREAREKFNPKAFISSFLLQIKFQNIIFYSSQSRYVGTARLWNVVNKNLLNHIQNDKKKSKQAVHRNKHIYYPAQLLKYRRLKGTKAVKISLWSSRIWRFEVEQFCAASSLDRQSQFLYESANGLPQEAICSTHGHMALFTQHHLSLLVLKKHIC